MLDLSVFLAKQEVTPGVPIALTGAADAMLVQNYVVTPMVAQEVRREIDRPFPGRRPSLPTAIHAQHSFDVEIAGSGTPTTPAYWSRLLAGCLFAAPVVTTTVAYALSSTGDGGALSIAGFKDSAKHPGMGARGNVKFSFVDGQLPKMSFDFLTLIDGGLPVVAAAPGAVTLPTAPAPVEVNLNNTAVVLDGFTLGVRSLEIDMGMKTTLFSTTGQRAIIFDKAADGDRRSAGGTAVFELPDPATRNFFSAIIAGTPLNLALTHGLVAGNIFSLGSGLGFVPRASTYTVESNRLFLTMPFDLVPTAANNEFLMGTR